MIKKGSQKAKTKTPKQPKKRQNFYKHVLPNSRRVFAVFKDEDGTETRYPVVCWALLEGEDPFDEFVVGLIPSPFGGPYLEETGGDGTELTPDFLRYECDDE